jgi:hypothetical protein
MADSRPQNVSGNEESQQLRERVSELDSLLEYILPYQTPTIEEIKDMVESPRGQPLLEIIAEYETL